MNVAEVKEAKRILEDEIHEMLSEFENDTGCTVTSINLDSFECTNTSDRYPRTYRNSVQLEVTV